VDPEGSEDSIPELQDKLDRARDDGEDMPKLVAALHARDQQLGIAVSVENVA
jgi:hypothetical protein